MGCVRVTLFYVLLSRGFSFVFVFLGLSSTEHGVDTLINKDQRKERVGDVDSWEGGYHVQKESLKVGTVLPLIPTFLSKSSKQTKRQLQQIRIDLTSSDLRPLQMDPPPYVLIFSQSTSNPQSCGKVFP